MTTYKTFLMHNSSSTWEKLIDIKDFPDLGGEPEQIETTTLSDRMKTYEPGIQDVAALSFTCGWDLSKYKELVKLKGKEEKYAVWFGGTEESGGAVTPTGDGGKFSWTGKLDVYKSGGGTNEHQEMIVTITPSSVISLDEE